LLSSGIFVVGVNGVGVIRRLVHVRFPWTLIR